MRKINIEATTDCLTKFIEDTVHSAGFKQVVVAVSGGIDSACAVSLAVKALGPGTVYALLLPYKGEQIDDATRARNWLTQLNIPKENVSEINIGGTVDEAIKSSDSRYPPSLKFRWASQLSDRDEKIRIGNIMARARMIVLFDLAKRLNVLVLGTENKSEHLLGYFTRFGDEASDIEPLRNLYKTEVFELANYLNVPEKIINQTPTAGLWIGQTDEGEFGFTYKEADEVLWGLYEAKISETELIKQGIKPEVIYKVKNWVKKVDFKHRLPYISQEPILI